MKDILLSPYKFVLKLKPLSQNAAKQPFLRKGSKFPILLKTSAYRKYEKELIRLLDQELTTLNAISKELSESMMILHLAFFIPKDKYFTKKGKENKTVGDADNFVKPFQDVLFSKLKGMDDYQIKKVVSEKHWVESEDYFIAVGVEGLSG